MGIRSSPILRRRRLAADLRKMRTDAGVRAVDVARELGCSPGKISQMETGRVAVSVPDAKAMLELYGVTDDRRETVIALARAAKLRGWWVPYNDTIHPWSQHYVGLETEASTLLAYQSEYVPGLLQTEAYLRAVVAGEIGRWSAEDADRLVALRRSRQQILCGDDPPACVFMLNEAVLHRRVGSPKVMREQLRRLLDAGRRANVTVRVLPFTAGAHPAMTGPFVLLNFPDPADPGVVYVEYLTGARYIEDGAELVRYGTAFSRLTVSALSKTRSAALIREVMKGLDT
jgi:transcriptional regulator with XRE-family HTH domain